LGRGGVGTVVLAADPVIGRRVALKTLRDRMLGDPELRRRFVDEAQITGQLEHPGIIPVYDVGDLDSGDPYYTMRVVARDSLRDILRDPERRRDFPLIRLIGLFIQVCRAVAYAHSR